LSDINLLQAILLGIVEGVTEFLPVSSTGHLLLCERWFNINLDAPNSFGKTFSVFIQIGAILSVVVYFRGRILDLLMGKREGGRTPLEISIAAGKASPNAAGTPTAAGMIDHESAPDEDLITPAQRLNALLMIAVATLPVLIVGFLLHDWMDRNLGSSRVVAIALLVGGIAMILIELIPTSVTTRRIERITWKQALGIGCAQILAALFPGTSRSAATILGGMLAGLSRPAAAEFSFFLAIPAMFAACGYALLKWVKQMHETHVGVSMQEVLLLAIGTLVSFLVAYAVIAVFMGYIKKHTFIPFAVYRIILGLIVLLLVQR
jgi:undecaprenyl-diphosphatase